MTPGRSTFNWLMACLVLAASSFVMAQEEPGNETARADLEQEIEQARNELAEAARRMARLQREMLSLRGEVRDRRMKERRLEIEARRDQSEQRRGEMESRLAEVEAWRAVAAESGEGDDDVVVRFNELMADELVLEGMPPRLGVLLGGEQSADANQVVGLTPGGGAEAAGIRQGDRLIEVAGRPVGDAAPGAIREALADVEAGEPVTVVVERDGKQLSFDVETSSVLRDVRVMVQRFAPEDGRQEREIVIIRPNGPSPPIPPIAPHPRFSGLGRDSDLISNHAGLEPYFGVADGVVVLRIDPENAFRLQDGDVVLRLDDQPVHRPVELGRALLGRKPGAAIVLEVMRRGALVEIQATIPERESLGLQQHFRFKTDMGRSGRQRPEMANAL